MIVDNFDLIYSIIKDRFTDENNFYVVEILKRRKENPEMTKSEKLIDIFEITSTNFDILKEKIINKCHEHNARAYIRLNKRSRKKIAFNYLKELVGHIYNEEYEIRGLYNKVLGSSPADENKTWLIDLDGDDLNFKDEIINLYQNLRAKAGFSDAVYYEIPTRNGLHLIVNPFNPNEFGKKFSSIQIHKDNGTILYLNL